MVLDDIWISVNDMLPERLERVLVVCHNRQNHDDKHVTIAQFWGVDKATGKHMWSGRRLVSYWASLPEMPKELDKSRSLKIDIYGTILRHLNNLEG